MNWNLKDHGDPIEKQALSFIESHGLYGYKSFWSKFVGRIGNEPAPLRGVDESSDRKRLLLAQWNYSILKNLYIIHKLYDERYRKHKIRKNSVNDVLHYDRDFILTTHLTYNSLELLNKIINLIKSAQGEGFYVKSHLGFINFRNLITHNIKPLTRIGTQYEVPKNLDWFIDNGADTENIIWLHKDFFNGLEYQSIDEYLIYCTQIVIRDFKGVLTEELVYCEQLFGSSVSNEIIEELDVPIVLTYTAPSGSGEYLVKATSNKRQNSWPDIATLSGNSIT